ncbi:hypothetical protein [Burkholderia phage FLC9]|nr:hypothetical protein [Burkholderia phage FLC9]
MDALRRIHLKTTYELPPGWSVWLYGNSPVHVVVMTPAGDVVTFTAVGEGMLLTVRALDDVPWDDESTEAYIADHIVTHVALELADMHVFGMNQLNDIRGSDVCSIEEETQQCA